MNVKPPKILTDLYQDLRDRHLLLPAAVLAVALIAVPVLLSKGAEPPPPAPAASVAETAATVPAVLADSEVSVRDYRRRLEELSSKNPFEQQFGVSPEEAAVGADGVPTDSSTAAPGGVPGLDAGIPPSSTPTPSAGGTGDPGSGTPDQSSGGTTDHTSGDSSPDDVEVVNQLVVRRVDVMVGIQGDQKRRDGVRPMTILPGEATPVLAFLGTDDSGKRAAFVVSSDVTSVGGDGACVPSPGCLFITLEKGESVTLDYGPDGQTYELELLRVRDVKLKTD